VKRENIFHGRKTENKFSREYDLSAEDFADRMAIARLHAARSLLHIYFAVPASTSCVGKRADITCRNRRSVSLTMRIICRSRLCGRSEANRNKSRRVAPQRPLGL